MNPQGDNPRSDPPPPYSAATPPPNNEGQEPHLPAQQPRHPARSRTSRYRHIMPRHPQPAMTTPALPQQPPIPMQPQQRMNPVFPRHLPVQRPIQVNHNPSSQALPISANLWRPHPYQALRTTLMEAQTLLVQVFLNHVAHAHEGSANERFALMMFLWRNNQAATVQQECNTCYLLMKSILQIDDQLHFHFPLP